MHAMIKWMTVSTAALAIVANMPQFAKAFGCKADDGMVRPDNLRANIW